MIFTELFIVMLGLFLLFTADIWWTPFVVCCRMVRMLCYTMFQIIKRKVWRRGRKHPGKVMRRPVRCFNVPAARENAETPPSPAEGGGN